MSGPIVSIETGAAHWASYLVNGDSSGLDPQEIELADKWAAALAPAYVVAIADCEETGQSQDPRFTWHYALHTGADCAGGEVVDYVLHTPAEKGAAA